MRDGQGSAAAGAAGDLGEDELGIPVAAQQVA
jgi:hypothetical protein